MSSFLLAFKTILPLFLIILAGVAMIRLKAATAQWSEVLNNYALKIGFPALIFTALLKMDFSFSEHATLEHETCRPVGGTFNISGAVPVAGVDCFYCLTFRVDPFKIK